MKKCYNCGIPMNELEKSNRTKEHIPAKALFVGYPVEYKDQRKTVPACRICNEEYSKIDDELRDVIGVLNNGENHKSELTEKSIRKILSNKKELNDRMHIEDGEIAFSFNATSLDKLHKKNFKGIYSIIKGEPLTDEYELDIYSDGQDEKKLDLGFTFLEEMEKLGNWNKSGHDDVFRYKIAHFDLKTDKLTEFEKETENALFLISAIEYNRTVVSVVVAVKSEIENEL